MMISRAEKVNVASNSPEVTNVQQYDRDREEEYYWVKAIKKARKRTAPPNDQGRKAFLEIFTFRQLV